MDALGKQILALVAFAMTFGFSIQNSQAIENIRPAPIESVGSAASCGTQGCHTRIYNEWAGAMHAKSVPEKDPIVAFFYKKLQEKAYDVKSCNACHVPIKAIYETLQPNASLDQNHALFKDGVTCSFCHAVHSVFNSKEKGIHYYKLDLEKPGTGPFEPDEEYANHEMSKSEIFRSIGICLGCHRQGEGDYIVTSEKKMLCQQCHMPSKQKKRSADTGVVREKVFRHLFEGGHSEEFLSMSLLLSGFSSIEEELVTLEIEIENEAFHSAPIGFPHRALYTKIEALNGDEDVLWENYSEDAYKEDPKGYFGKIYKTEDALFAHHAKELKPTWENLFPPKDITTLSYEFNLADMEGVESFRITVYYRLISPMAIKQLGIDPKLSPEVTVLEEYIYIE